MAGLSGEKGDRQVPVPVREGSECVGLHWDSLSEQVQAICVGDAPPQILPLLLRAWWIVAVEWISTVRNIVAKLPVIALPTACFAEVPYNSVGGSFEYCDNLFSGVWINRL